MKSQPTRRGRPAQYVKGRDGKPVVGLSLHKPSGTYYATHSKPRTYFGKDFDQALFLFRQWLSKQKQEKVEVKHPLAPEALRLTNITRKRKNMELLPKDYEVLSVIPSDAFWAKVRYELFANPKLFADRVGEPRIGYLQDLKPPLPSPTLDEVGDIYESKARITAHERRKSKLFWKEFKNTAKAKTIRDITQDHVIKYYDWVINYGQSQTWIKHRFGKIKTILRFAQNRTKTPEDIERVLTYCKMLAPPRKNSADPSPISQANFRALLDVADSKWQAILLCSLNFCMYGKEVADLERDEIDLRKRTLVTNRSKTGVTRIAAVWKQTCLALKEVPKHRRSHLFLNQAGTPFHPDHIRRGFARLRVKAGLDEDVKISDIRDGAYTAAVESGAIRHDILHICARVLATVSSEDPD
jgi:integrase